MKEGNYDAIRNFFHIIESNWHRSCLHSRRNVPGCSQLPFQVTFYQENALCMYKSRGYTYFEIHIRRTRYTKTYHKWWWPLGWQLCFQAVRQRLDIWQHHLLTKILSIKWISGKNKTNDKKVIKKAKDSNTGIDMALLCLRTAPINHDLPSPT